MQHLDDNIKISKKDMIYWVGFSIFYFLLVITASLLYVAVTMDSVQTLRVVILSILILAILTTLKMVSKDFEQMVLSSEDYYVVYYASYFIAIANSILFTALTIFQMINNI